MSPALLRTCDPLPGSFADLAAGRETGARGCPPQGGAAGVGSLPCQNSNNCAEAVPVKGYKLRKKTTIYRGRAGLSIAITATATGAHEGLDRDGRGWELQDDGQTWARTFGGISSAEAKRAFALRRNVEAFAAHYRHEACGFLTLTPERANMTPSQMGEAWHLMRRRGLPWVRSYVRVLEPQKRGAPHYHLLVATPYDLRPGAFDWDALQGAAEARKRGDLAEAKALTRAYAESAPDCLRDCWRDLRELCPAYGLGRSEFLPFRKSAGAVANYVGKYLEAGLAFRRDEWKGARRVEYDRGESREWKACAAAFGWVSPGAKAWRARVGELAAALAAQTPADIVRILGSRWAYHVRPTIMTASDDEWRGLLLYLSGEYGGTVKEFFEKYPQNQYA